MREEMRRRGSTKVKGVRPKPKLHPEATRKNVEKDNTKKRRSRAALV